MGPRLVCRWPVCYVCVDCCLCGLTSQRCTGSVSRMLCLFCLFQNTFYFSSPKVNGNYHKVYKVAVQENTDLVVCISILVNINTPFID